MPQRVTNDHQLGWCGVAANLWDVGSVLTDDGRWALLRFASFGGAVISPLSRCVFNHRFHPDCIIDFFVDRGQDLGRLSVENWSHDPLSFAISGEEEEH